MASCPACATPLPEDALFCPRCGASTPTEISKETGAPAPRGPAPAGDAAVAMRRQELQRALGESFEIRDPIGQGGFGEVWAATDLKLKRTVAVKVLRSDLVASASLLERFRREAEAAARLRHPNIIPIYQVGEGQGLLFFVMPLIKGESLRALLERQGRLPVAETVRILSEAAGALDEAHSAGIVHRDIKPDNILLEGPERRVLLMDFGIAKSVEVQESGLTGTGMVVGTPQYMSPEQASGEKSIDRRSDLYSLGVVAYQMLTGRLPFEAESAQGLIVAHIATPPEPLARLAPEVPPEVADAVMRLLAKNPQVRFASAKEFAAAIRPLAPVSEESPLKWVTKRVRRSVRAARHRMVYYGAALLLAVLTLLATDRRLFVKAWRFWSAPAPQAAPRQALWPSGRRLPWMWWGVPTPSLRSVGESLLVLTTPGRLSGPQLFDGRTWRTVAVPGYNVPEPAIGRDTLWFFAVEGRRTLVYALTRAGLNLRDSIGDSIRAVWGTGSVALLSTWEGGMLRGWPGAWRREPTGTRTPATSILGDARRQVALGFFARSGVADSLLVFNGLNWRTVDPRPDRARWWVYNAGDVLPDGTLLVAGRDCSVSMEGCRGLLAELPPGSDRWRPVQAAMPEGVDFMQVAARRPTDVWLVGTGRACDEASCLFRVSAGRIEKMTTPRREVAVTAIAFLRGEPVALDARGVVWTLRGGSWGVLGEVPGWIARGSDSRGSAAWSDATVVQEGVVGVRGIASVISGGQVRHWVLAHGRVFEQVCAGETQFCSAGLAELPAVPFGAAVSALAAIGSELAVAAPAPGASPLRWRGGRWEPMRVRAGEGRPDSVIAFASGDGEAVAALTPTAVWRWDSAGGEWGRWQTLPPWLGRPLRFAVDPEASAAFIVGDAATAVLHGPGEFDRYDTFGTPAAVTILGDGRAVLAYPSPEDPLLGSRLTVTTPLAAGQLRSEPADAPYGADVYGLGRRNCFLWIAGSGGMIARVLEMFLPLADTASGTLELRGDLPRGVVVTVDDQPRAPGRIRLAPGLHVVGLSAKGYQDERRGVCVSSRRTLRFTLQMQRTGGGS